MWAAPDFERKLWEHHRFVVSHSEHVQVRDRGERRVVIDRARDRGIVIAGEEYDGDGGGRDRFRSPVEQRFGQAMAFKSIAGEHHDIGAESARGVEYTDETCGAVAAVELCGIVMIDMQVGAVRDHDLLFDRARIGGAGMIIRYF